MLRGRLRAQQSGHRDVLGRRHQSLLDELPNEIVPLLQVCDHILAGLQTGGRPEKTLLPAELRWVRRGCHDGPTKLAAAPRWACGAKSFQTQLLPKSNFEHRRHRQNCLPRRQMAERASSGLSPRRISPRKGTGAVSPATGTSPAAVGTSPAAAKTSPAAAKTSPAAAASTTPPAAAAGTSLSAAGTSPAASGTSPAAASTSPQLGADRERKRKREGSPGVRGSGSPAGVGGPAATMELVEVPPAPMSRELLLSEEPSEPPAPHFSLSPFGLDRLRSDIRNACSEVVDQLGPTAHSPVPGLEDVSLADAASEEGKAHRLHVLRVVRECAVSKPLVALATVRAANLAWPADATFSVGPSSSALVEAVVHAATIWPECAVGDEVPPFEPNHQEGVLLSTGGRAKEGGRKKRRVSFGACLLSWRAQALVSYSRSLILFICFPGTVNERLFDMNSPTRRRLDPFESASDYSKWSQWPFRLEEVRTVPCPPATPCPSVNSS